MKEFLMYVDHTVLSQSTKTEDIDKLCAEALEYRTSSVCIPPSYVEYVSNKYEGLNVCTVIGFPHGYNTKEVKVFETRDAISKGANEIDMVINVTHVKEGLWSKILEEINDIKTVCGDKVLKVIVETSLLTEDEKIKMTEIVSQSDADFIKTSTGFAGGGATLDDIKLINEHKAKDLKVKASGGISSYEDIEIFLELNVDRLGSSRAVSIYKNLKKGE